MECTIHGPVVLDKHVHKGDLPELCFGHIAFGESESPDSGTVQLFFSNVKQVEAAIAELQDLGEKMTKVFPRGQVLEFKHD